MSGPAGPAACSIGADEIALVAAPDLANLRNAKKLMDLLRRRAPNDRRPKLVINMAGVPKRPEIAPAEFAKALDASRSRSIPFDPQLFGTAANNGQMIAEIEPTAKSRRRSRSCAGAHRPRGDQEPSRRLLTPLLETLRRKK